MQGRVTRSKSESNNQNQKPDTNMPRPIPGKLPPGPGTTPKPQQESLNDPCTKSDLQEINKTLLLIHSEQKTLSESVAAINTRINIIEKENTTLKEEVCELKAQLNKSQEEQRRLYDEIYKNYIVIRGVPILENEDLHQLVCDLANVLKIQLGERDIKHCRRIYPRVLNKEKATARSHPVIIVELQNYNLKHQFLTNFKNNGAIGFEQLNIICSSTTASTIQVNQYSHPETRKLFYAARKFKSTFGIKFVWERNNVILVKTLAGETHQIKNTRDLAKVEDILQQETQQSI